MDRKIWDRERKWQDKLDTLEDELATSLTYTGKGVFIYYVRVFWGSLQQFSNVL